MVTGELAIVTVMGAGVGVGPRIEGLELELEASSMVVPRLAVRPLLTEPVGET